MPEPGEPVIHQELPEDPQVSSVDYTQRKEMHGDHEVTVSRAVPFSSKKRTQEETQRMELELAIKAGEERAALRKKKEEETKKKNNIIEFPNAA